MLIPPFILHRIVSEQEGSAVLVLANTLYDVDDPRTHDHYSDAAFRRLQRRHAAHVFAPA
jgi:hypothetical protein